MNETDQVIDSIEKELEKQKHSRVFKMAFLDNFVKDKTWTIEKQKEWNEKSKQSQKSILEKYKNRAL